MEEDVPYGDLPTHLLAIGKDLGESSFTPVKIRPSAVPKKQPGCSRMWYYGYLLHAKQQKLSADFEFLVAKGPAKALHVGWKVALNLLEYVPGIATRTQRKEANQAHQSHPIGCNHTQVLSRYKEDSYQGN